MRVTQDHLSIDPGIRDKRTSYNAKVKEKGKPTGVTCFVKCPGDTATGEMHILSFEKMVSIFKNGHSKVTQTEKEKGDSKI